MFDFNEYNEASTVEEALSLISRARNIPIAGGTAILTGLRDQKTPAERTELPVPPSLVDINGIPELNEIKLNGDGSIHIGAAVTLKKIIKDRLVTERLPLLAEAASAVAGPQIRNMATIGGNICCGFGGADCLTPLLALNAKLKISSQNGVRLTELKDFKKEPGELLTEIIIARDDYENYSGCFYKYAQRNALDGALLSCSVMISLQPDGERISEARIALGGISVTPTLRLYTAEEALKGRIFSPDGDGLAEIQEQILNDAGLVNSSQLTDVFTEQIIREVSARCLLSAYNRARTI